MLISYQSVGTGGSDNSSYRNAGGGGGAGAAGQNGGPGYTGGAGGIGLASSITGTPVYYAGGGGGGTAPNPCLFSSWSAYSAGSKKVLYNSLVCGTVGIGSFRVRLSSACLASA